MTFKTFKTFRKFWKIIYEVLKLLGTNQIITGQETMQGEFTIQIALRYSSEYL